MFHDKTLSKNGIKHHILFGGFLAKSWKDLVTKYSGAGLDTK